MTRGGAIMIRGALLLVVGVFASLALTGCDTDVDAVVCHWGDSVMAQSTNEIADKEVFRDNGYVPGFNAIGGSGLNNWDAYWRTRIPKLRAAVQCDVNVVMLGNNDATNTRCCRLPTPTSNRSSPRSAPRRSSTSRRIAPRHRP